MKKIIFILLHLSIIMSVSFAKTKVEELIPDDGKLTIMTDSIKYAGQFNLPTEINRDDFDSAVIEKIKEKYISFVDEETSIDTLSQDEIKKARELLEKVYTLAGVTYQIKKKYDNTDYYNLARLLTDYSFSPELAKIQSLEKLFTSYIMAAMSRTNKFEIINVNLSKEITEERIKTLKGQTTKTEKFESPFSKYVLTGTYTPLSLSESNFLSVKVIDAITGEVLYLTFSEVNESNMRDNIYREIFTMTGQDYQSTEISVDKSDKSKWIDGFTVNITPSKGAVTSVLYALDREYKFYSHNIKLPALPAGDYILSVEKIGYVPEQEIILVYPGEKTETEIKLRKQYGALIVNTVEEGTSITMDRKATYTSGETIYIPRQDIGTHKLKLSKSDYYSQYKSIEIEDGNQTEVDVDLKVKPVRTLFTSNIKDTSIYIDDVFCGVTPAVIRLSDGEHKIEFRRQFYYSDIKYVTIDTPEIRVISGNLTVNNEEYKLKREFYPHFFMTLSAYWGTYSYLFLENNPLYLGSHNDANMAGNMMFMGGFAYSIGLDLEYLFLGVRTLLTMYNNDPQWKNSSRPLALNLDIIPYFGFKVYAGLYTSFDFGIGYDLPMLKSEPANNDATCPMANFSPREMGLFQNWMFLFDITFYNKYKREAFGFEFMFRLGTFDELIESNKAFGYKQPGMLYFGIKLPFCYTSSKKRQMTKDYTVIQNREKANTDTDKLLQKMHRNKGGEK